MGIADLCGLASCLGLWLNKQVKSADKDTHWSSQPHLHPRLPPTLLHSTRSSGLASPCATSSATYNKSQGHCHGKTTAVIQQHNLYKKAIPV